MSQADQEPSSTGNTKTEGGLSGIGKAVRPVAKELIKGGLLVIGAVSKSLSEIGQQFTALVDEAKAEAKQTPASHVEPEEEKLKKVHKSHKAKDSAKESSH